MALERADFYDAELRRHHEPFRGVINAGPRDHVSADGVRFDSRVWIATARWAGGR